MKTAIETNSLKFTISKKIGQREFLKIEIVLNDSCKNGHQDFYITADHTKNNRVESFGCLHDMIEEHAPEFKQFILLHGRDYTGAPTYAIENGFYSLTKLRAGEETKESFCNYMRLNKKEFNQINKNAFSEVSFYLQLKELGIFDKWKEEANQGIKALEKLTGKKFLIDSKRTQINHPEPEQIKEEINKIESGHYTPKERKQREKEAFKKYVKEENEKFNNKITSLKEERSVKMQVLKKGGIKAYKSCIFYNHSRTLSFNWSSSDVITAEEYKTIKDKLKLPEGVKIELKTAK
jgi:hypothetical protein